MIRLGFALCSAAALFAAAPATAADSAAHAKSPPAHVSYVPLPGREQIQAPVKSYAELRFRGIERQTLDLSCGAAALATLLHGYFGLPVTEAQVIRGVLLDANPEDAKKVSESGFSMLELKHFAESQGLVAGGFKTNKPDDLAKLRAPAIALINSRGYEHFVVVRSVRANIVAFADPVFGNRSEPLATFAKRWNGVILVAVNPGHKVNTNFMDAPPGLYDPRGAQLFVTQNIVRTLNFLPGDFY
jgi:predicted double-glycine peptidase